MDRMKHSPIIGKPRCLVTGAGGFIGSHLVKALKSQGFWVRGVDLKYPEFEPTVADEFLILDLRFWESCLKSMRDIEYVYALAADMGGMGFISCNNAKILHNNSLINIHTLEAARHFGVVRYLYSSSACVYPTYAQVSTDVKPLKEEDAYPAMPEDAYGWEKLVHERLCKHYRDDYGFETRVIRFHNIYGPMGTYMGGREKAPAALCRKVAMAVLKGERSIDVWGDGEQTRSFCYIEDCINGILRIMDSNHHDPINLGSEELVSINQLATMVIGIAGVFGTIAIKHVPGPQGVRGRNSDNTKLRAVLGWEPTWRLEEGLQETYDWVWTQLMKK